jgi:hypothetical protein
VGHTWHEANTSPPTYRTKPTPWATNVRRVIIVALLGLILFALLTHAGSQQVVVAKTQTVTVKTSEQASFWYWAQEKCPSNDPRQVTPIIQKDNLGRVTPGTVKIGDKLRVPVCK